MAQRRRCREYGDARGPPQRALHYRGPQACDGADGRLALVFPMDDQKIPGIAVEDIACAAEVYLRAMRQGVGTWLDLY